MKNMKICKVILIIIATLLVLSITFDVNAANSTGNLMKLDQTGSTNNATNNTTNKATNNTAKNNVVNNSAVNTTNKTNTSAYKNNNTNNLPKTGIEDHTGLFAILGVCVVSAIYAYRKVNHYDKMK